MAEAPHRLASQMSMQQAEGFEQARQDACSPIGDSDAGVTLHGASAADVAALAMTGDADLADGPGPLTSYPGAADLPPDWLAGEDVTS